MKDEDNLLTKVDLLSLSPMENYEAPDLPTLYEAKPKLLKKVPLRWKNKAMIAVTAGLFGTTILTGCSLIDNMSASNHFYCSDLHHGGAGMAPIYVVSITEQEALEMIRYQLESIGLNLVEPSTSINVMPTDIYLEIGDHGEVYDTHPMFQNEIEIQLIDEEKNVGIVLHGWWRNLESSCTIGVHERIVHRFSREHDLSVGMFFRTSHGTSFDEDEIWNLDDEELDQLENDDESFIQARSRAEQDLNRQIQDFIDQLREDGIID